MGGKDTLAPVRRVPRGSWCVACGEARAATRSGGDRPSAKRPVCRQPPSVRLRTVPTEGRRTARLAQNAGVRSSRVLYTGTDNHGRRKRSLLRGHALLRGCSPALALRTEALPLSLRVPPSPPRAPPLSRGFNCVAARSFGSTLRHLGMLAGVATDADTPRRLSSRAEAASGWGLGPVSWRRPRRALQTPHAPSAHTHTDTFFKNARSFVLRAFG